MITEFRQHDSGGVSPRVLPRVSLEDVAEKKGARLNRQSTLVTLVYFLAGGQLNHGAEHPSQNRSMQHATFLVYLLDSVLKQGYSGVSAEFACTALCPSDLGNS